MAYVPRGSPGRAGERRQSQPRPPEEEKDAAGRNAAIVALPPVVAARVALARQRVLERRHDQGAHQAGVAKAHLGLGRMHVDVDLARIERHEQRQQRMAVARQIIGIGAAHRADQKLVAHRPAIDEQILAERIGARERRQRGEAFDRDALALRRDLDRVGAEVGAENVAEARQAPGGAGERRGIRHRRALLAGEREGDVGPAHGEAAHHLAHRLGLGAVLFEEFEPRRRGVKQVAHLDARALAERGRLRRRFHAGIDLDRPGVRLAPVARRDRKPRHRADRRQRLAAKAERRDGNKILVGELRGGVALDRQRQIGARHALAVVGDADEPPPAAVGEDVDAARAGIERVLDQFLHHARRPLHHLARGDAVDDGFGELADGHRRLGCGSVVESSGARSRANSEMANGEWGSPSPFAIRHSLFAITRTRLQSARYFIQPRCTS